MPQHPELQEVLPNPVLPCGYCSEIQENDQPEAGTDKEARGCGELPFPIFSA